MTIRVARITARTSVLGPGLRSVLWVQGCPLSCRGCIATEILDPSGGTPMTVAQVADQLLEADAIDGVTFSGGEPFAQAAGLTALADELCRRRPSLTIMSYSGFPIERLRRGDAAQRALLERVDILIDGPYIAAQHRPLLWRASANQRIHVLSDSCAQVRALVDAPAGIDVHISPDGDLDWTGVPPAPGFRDALGRALHDHGLEPEANPTTHEQEMSHER